MTVALYSTKICAEVLAAEEKSAQNYRKFPEVNMYWCMVDLVQSSNYRISQGPEKGYIRGESFFSLVNAAIGPNAEVRAFKEIGDAVLLCANGLRPIYEACLLMSVSASQLAHVAATDNYTFSIRMGIDFGNAKKLSRLHEDYLGEPIDRLARLMSIRSEDCQIILSDQAYRSSREIVDEYKDFCSVSVPKQMHVTKDKQLLSEVIYREISINEEAISGFSDYFEAWKQSKT